MNSEIEPESVLGQEVDWSIGTLVRCNFRKYQDINRWELQCSLRRKGSMIGGNSSNWVVSLTPKWTAHDRFNDFDAGTGRAARARRRKKYLARSQATKPRGFSAGARLNPRFVRCARAAASSPSPRPQTYGVRGQVSLLGAGDRSCHATAGLECCGFHFSVGGELLNALSIVS